jgi:hypothetical protein
VVVIVVVVMTVMLDDHDFPMLPVAPAVIMVADMDGNAFFSARGRRRQSERESADGGERQNDSAHVVFLWGYSPRFNARCRL